MMRAEMQAAVLRKHAAPPEYLQWSIPERGKGQALVRVLAAPISPLDLLCASGTSYFGAPKLPYIPGTQGVGIVMEADALAPGKRVWFSCEAGMKPGDGNHPHLARYLAESEDRPQRKLYLWFRPLARRDCRVYRQASSVKTASPLEKVVCFPLLHVSTPGLPTQKK
jgi:hypothetical protein